MKKLLILALLPLAGCTTSPPLKPYFFEGAYYMGGDADCVNARSVSPTRIMCGNAAFQETGYRDAMTDQQLYVYQTNKLASEAAAGRSAKAFADGLSEGFSKDTHRHENTQLEQMWLMDQLYN